MDSNLRGKRSFPPTIDADLLYRRTWPVCIFLSFSIILSGVLLLSQFHGLVSEREAILRRRHDQTSEYLRGAEQMITATYYQLATDVYIAEWLRDAYRPNIDYYNLYLTYDRMVRIISSYPLIESIYLLSYGNQKVLPTSFMFSTLDDFPLKRLFFDPAAENSGWLPSIWERTSGANARRIFPFVMPATLNALNGQVVINLNENLLMYGIPTGSDGVLILDLDGGVLSSSAPEFASIFVENSDLFETRSGDVSIHRVAFDGGAYYMQISTSPTQYWHIVSFVDAMALDLALRGGVQAAWFVFVLCGALLLTGLALLLLFYKLKKIQQQRVGELLLQNRSARDADLINQILVGAKDDSILRRAIETPICTVFKSDFRVVNFELNNYNPPRADEAVISHAERNLLMIALRTFFLEKWRTATSGKKTAEQLLILRIEPDKMAVVLPDLLEEDQLRGVLEDVQKDVRRSGSHNFCAAVSEAASGVESASRAYFQTIHFLSFKQFFDADSILCREDVRRHEDSTVNFPVGAIGHVATLINQGHSEGFEEKLDAALGNLADACRYNINLVNAAFANVLFELVKLTSDEKSERLVRGGDEFFVRLYAFDRIDDKLRFTKELCLRVATQRRRVLQNLDNVLAQRIDTFIQEQFDKEISLSMLAEEFQLNASYVSTLIKRELGLNFNGYINELRVKKSVSLLRNSNIIIREVAAKCGYDDVHTYIRNFKKFYHTTPAEFRKTSGEPN